MAKKKTLTTIVIDAVVNEHGRQLLILTQQVTLMTEHLKDLQKQADRLDGLVAKLAGEVADLVGVPTEDSNASLR